MVAMIRAWAVGMGFWLPVKQIAATFYGVDALLGGAVVILVGLMTHMVVSATFGAIFALLVGRRASLAMAAIYGVVWGIVIWAGMTFLGLPIVNDTMRERVAMQPIWWFVYHIVFGVMLFLTPLLARFWR